MRVAVIGTGYVGLTTGVSLAFLGHQVTCVDVNESKINQLKSGILPFYEPLLKEILAVAQPNIAFSVSLPDAVQHADLVFLAVGTPANPDGSPHLGDFFSAAHQTIQSLRNKETPAVLVNKSTVPVGTSDQIQEWVEQSGLGLKVSVASNPEFLRQGRAVLDTLYPDRIVVGGDEPAVEALRQLYADIIGQRFAEPAGAPRPSHLHEVPFLAVDRRSAEISKYAANAFLAMKISFINEIANVCDRVGANVHHAAQIIGLDPRIGSSFLQAGIGYGGSCFPKDTRALQYIAETSGYDFKLLSAVIEVNNAQKFILLDKVRAELRHLRGKKIAVLGLSFKPQTDDMREAPSIPVIQGLLAEGAEVYAHDPIALDNARKLLPPSVHLESRLHDALEDAEAALLVTDWPEYLNLDPEYIRQIMRRPLWIDGRNALGPAVRSGIEYRGIGVDAAHFADPAQNKKETHYETEPQYLV